MEEEEPLIHAVRFVPGGMAYFGTVTIETEWRLNKPAMDREIEETGSEIVRTIAFEALDEAMEQIQELGAIDTGNMRATGYVETGDGIKSPVSGIGGAKVLWTPEGPFEAKMAFGAEYTEAVHEGLGSNAAYGPRPFVKNAETAMAERGRKIAEDVIRRRYRS